MSYVLGAIIGVLFFLAVNGQLGLAVVLVAIAAAFILLAKLGYGSESR